MISAVKWPSIESDRHTINYQTLMLGLIVIMALALWADSSFAGTGGVAFDEVWSTLKDWIQGTLGRVIAGAIILVGIVGGIARQSLMSFAVGVGGGMGLYASPKIVETIMSATLPVIDPILPLMMQLSNGLQ